MALDVGRIPQLAVLKQAVASRNLVPLIGAGVSRQASPALPSWEALLRDMKDHAVNYGWLNRPEAEQIDALLDQNQFLMVAQDLHYRYPVDAYYRFLQSKFEPPDLKPAAIHSAVLSLKAPLILTTNYDRLIEDAYADQFRQSAAVRTYIDSPDIANYLHSPTPGRSPYIFKIHGSIDNTSSIILTEQDYRNLIYRQPGYRMVLSTIFISKVVLMLGFSFNDYELRLLLEGMRESLQHRTDPDYIFVRSTETNETLRRRYREDYGIEAITYDPTPGDPELIEFVNALAEAAPSD